MSDVVSQESRHAFRIYAKRGVQIERGKDVWLWDNAGKQYLDCMSGHGVMNVGHGNPVIIDALKTQLDRLVSCPGVFDNDVRGAYMARLVLEAPTHLSRVFLCNSGTESIEAALKFARFHTGRTGIVAAKRGFHGRTMGALSSTYNPDYRLPFGPLIPDVQFASFNRADSFRAVVDSNTAAVLIEIIQGEGGIHVAAPAFLSELADICRENGSLLIVDEIQTGFGRTGELFASSHFQLKPDMICLAKAAGSGFPIGAVLCREQIKAPLGNHGSTFGGNPLACAAGIATLDVIRDSNLLKNCRKMGKILHGKLDALDLSKVREIRGLGLMIGLELKERVKPYILQLMESGVLALPAGKRVLRLLPPLTIDDEQVEFLVNILYRLLR